MQGIYNIVPTPFDTSGAIDEPSLRRLIDFIIDTDVDGRPLLFAFTHGRGAWRTPVFGSRPPPRPAGRRATP